MHVFLTGFMGAGKTTVGRLLAERLALPFADLDGEIERRSGLTIRELFERHGEPTFRTVETESLRTLCAGPESVIATGGGTPTIDDSLRLLKASGIAVFLNPPFAAIVERVGAQGKADRPLFRDETQLWDLYRHRLPIYRTADLTVDMTAAEGAAEVAARIALLLKDRRCAI